MTTNKLAAIEQKAETALQEFERNRDAIGEEILRLKTDMIKHVEDMLNKLETSLTQKTGEVDREIEKSIADLKRSIAKKKELDQFMQSLTPVLCAAIDTNKDVKRVVF